MSSVREAKQKGREGAFLGEDKRPITMSKIDTDESLISEDEILAEESDEDDHFTSLSVQRGGIRASIIPESDPESDEENGHVQSPVETVRRLVYKNINKQKKMVV